MKDDIELDDPVFAAALQLFIDKVQSETPPIKKWTDEEVKELYYHAYYFYKNGKYTEAVDAFRTLTYIDATDVGYWLGLAGALKMKNEYAQALDIYSIAALLDATDPMLYAHAADCCFALGDITGGMQALENAEDLAAGQEEYRLLLSQLAVIKEAWTHKINK